MSDREGGPEFLVVFSPLFFFRLSLELVESRSFSFFHPFISVVVRRNFFNIFFFFQSASKSVLSPLVSDRHRYRQQIKTALVIFSSVALGFLVIFPIQVIMHVHDYDYDYDPNDFSPAALAFFFFYSFFIPFMLFHPTAVEIFFFFISFCYTSMFNSSSFFHVAHLLRRSTHIYAHGRFLVCILCYHDYAY